MFPRSGLDSICKQVLFLRTFGVFGSQSTSCYSRKSPSLQPPPKRNINAYVMFIKDLFPSLVKEHPGASASTLISIGAEKWRKLDQETLEKFKQLASEERKQYKIALGEYYANLTPEMEAALAKSKEAKAQTKKKKLLKTLGMPKRPPNGFILFFLDYAQKNSESMHVIKDSRKVASLWSSLPDSERAKWVELSASKTKQYKKDLEQWEQEMVSKGYLEVIHSKGKSRD